MIDGDGPSRREILAGASGLGVFGAVGGAGTYAVLNDSEEFPGSSIAAGELGLAIDCQGGGCETDGNAVSVSFGGIEPGDTGTRTIELTVEGNAARLWLRTACPPASDPLGDALAVTLSDDEGCGGTGELFSGSLTDLRREFADGISLSEGCLDPGDTRCLTLEWNFSEEDVEGLVGLSAELELEFVAEQCRHTDGTENPFGESGDCSEPPCPDCVELGRADVEPDSVSPGDRFSLGSGYEIKFLSVTNKGDGETVCGAIRLLREGSEAAAPAICKVVVRGGPPDHAGGSGRKSQRGSGPASGAKEFEIDPPATRTRGEVCTGQREGGNSGKVFRPAISNVMVHICQGESQ
ncbi:SipW-dependent-type signal peptide-containing protein [Saliphagus infecundisoli]|uniref:SipW-dependent-type signal peptide-containing protein n=1 Tax=Saliphagus infecundisoli TaxID=1849069 RepID=A0ABD5QED8_9EURY|nr:SipW-dependent-type signal peptide-containing protein [Saliphagus infecundisoli]